MSTYSPFSPKVSVIVPPSPKPPLIPILLFLVVGGSVIIFAISSFWREPPKIQLKDVLNNGKSYVCTISEKTSKGTTSGTVYGVGYGARAEIRAEIIKSSGKEKNTTYLHVKSERIYLRENSTFIHVDSKMAYLWENSDKQGIKFSVEDIKDSKLFGGQGMSFDCKDWTPNNSVFQIPTDIKFTETTEIIKDSEKKLPPATTGNSTEPTSPPPPEPIKPPLSEEKEKERIQVEINATYEWVVLATNKAFTVCKNLEKIPLVQRLREIAEQDKLSAEFQQETQQNLDRLRDRINNVMSEYIENIKKIGGKDKDIANKAVDRYRKELSANQEREKLKILDKAIHTHLTQYAQYNKITPEQWKADLERL